MIINRIHVRLACSLFGIHSVLALRGTEWVRVSGMYTHKEAAIAALRDMRAAVLDHECAIGARVNPVGCNTY